MLFRSVTWRAEIGIPGIKSKLTLTDTIIFISALLLGPWAAATLASIDGLARSPRRSKNPRAASALLNMAAMNLSVLGSVLLATAIFGSLPWLVADPGHLDRFVLALGLMAAISYVMNTGLAAISVALVWFSTTMITSTTACVATMPTFASAQITP